MTDEEKAFWKDTYSKALLAKSDDPQCEANEAIGAFRYAQNLPIESPVPIDREQILFDALVLANALIDKIRAGAPSVEDILRVRETAAQVEVNDLAGAYR